MPDSINLTYRKMRAGLKEVAKRQPLNRQRLVGFIPPVNKPKTRIATATAAIPHHLWEDCVDFCYSADQGFAC
jgi:hypothetical protein